MRLTLKTEMLGLNVEYAAKVYTNKIHLWVPLIIVREGARYSTVQGQVINSTLTAHCVRLYLICKMNLEAWQHIGLAANVQYLQRLKQVT